MRFSEELEQGMRGKWRAYYINYRGMRDRIEEMESTSMSNEEFMTMLKSQMLKAMRFYESAETRIRELVAENRANLADETIKQELEELSRYAKLNVDGLRKIAKKYDKRCGQSKTMQADVMETLQGSKIADASLRITQIRERFKRQSSGGVASPLLRQSTLSESSGRIGRTESTKNRVSLMIERHVWAQPDRRKSLSSASVYSAVKTKWRTEDMVEVLVPAFLALICFGLWQLQPSDRLDWRSYLTVFVTAQSLVMLVRQRPPDVTLIFATLVLRLAGVLGNKEAWAGFSNDVVLSVAVLGIVSAGVQNTGVVEALLMRILGKPRSYGMALPRLCAPALMLNVCISNTCVMGVLIPVIQKWSKDIRLHPALFLMPMSYLMLISGTFAIFSTSTNLIAQGLLSAHKLPMFNNFGIAKLCAACTLVSIMYLIVAVPFVLRRFTVKASEEKGEEGLISPNSTDMKLFIASVQISGSSLDSVGIAESGLLQALRGGLQDVVRLERMGAQIFEFSPETLLQQYDVLYVWTTVDCLMALLNFPALTFMALDAGFEHKHDAESRCIVEVVLDGLCPLVGESLVSTRSLETTYSANCLAVRPCGIQHFTEAVAQAEEARHFLRTLRHASAADPYRIHIGDNLLLDVQRNFVKLYQNSAHFASVRLVERGDDGDEEDADAAERQRERRDQVVSGLILVVMIALVASTAVPLLQASLLAVYALVATGCLPQDAAFNAVKIRTVLSIVGAFGLGKAMGKTNVAGVLATGLCEFLAPLGAHGVLAAIFAATAALGVVFHGTAVVVLMFPICTEVCDDMARRQVEIHLHHALAVLMIAASCQMLSPISYQTNLMAYATGHYTFGDFFKVGFGLVVSIGITTVAAVDQLVTLA